MTGRNEAFSRWKRSYLSSLPAVEHVTEDRIYYSDAFKRDCIRRHRRGESAARIFEAAGLPARLIGYKRIERSIARWSKSLADDALEPEDAAPFAPEPVGQAGPIAPGQPTLADLAEVLHRVERRLACIESRLGGACEHESPNKDSLE